MHSVWGSSLAYANEDGSGAAASPTILKAGTLADTSEIIIASDQECNDDCGTVRPGAVAYSKFYTYSQSEFPSSMAFTDNSFQRVSPVLTRSSSLSSRCP